MLKTIYDNKKIMLLNDPNKLVYIISLSNINASYSDERTIFLEFKDVINPIEINNAVSKWVTINCNPQLAYSLFPITSNTCIIKV